jgi:large subunit ribosomal protein L16
MSLLMPRKMKYRKLQRGVTSGVSVRGSKLAFGRWGIKVIEPGWISARQLEAARRAMTRYVQRGGQIWIRVFPDKPVTQTSPETPMGKGKGSVDHFVVAVRPGRILFEMDGVTEAVAYEALRLAKHKIGLRTKIIEKV